MLPALRAERFMLLRGAPWSSHVLQSSPQAYFTDIQARECAQLGRLFLSADGPPIVV